MEAEAWRLASEFIAPAEALRKDMRALGRVASVKNLATLKRKWGVSMQALTRRLRDTNQITPEKYKSIHVQLSRLGYRKQEPVSLPPESESLFPKVFQMLKNEGQLSLSDLASAFRIRDKTFIDLYGKYWGGIESQLRLVK